MWQMQNKNDWDFCCFSHTVFVLIISFSLPLFNYNFSSDIDSVMEQTRSNSVRNTLLQRKNTNLLKYLVAVRFLLCFPLQLRDIKNFLSLG